jgi:hypothetical protein
MNFVGKRRRAFNDIIVLHSTSHSFVLKERAVDQVCQLLFGKCVAYIWQISRRYHQI